MLLRCLLLRATALLWSISRLYIINSWTLYIPRNDLYNECNVYIETYASLHATHPEGIDSKWVQLFVTK